MTYKILKVIDANEVPDWERRPAKWQDLVDKVFELEPGQTLTVLFDDVKTATRARNAVRDTANLKARAIIVRTRVTEQENDKAMLYLTRVKPIPSKK